jgi:N-acetyl sugar amidotransferase
VSGYRVCTTCVMDTSDPDIRFDDAGRCNHCRRFEKEAAVRRAQGAPADVLERRAAAIRKANASREYDCVIGVSGGVDSTYVALLTNRLGLRALAVHFDNGWNSNLAVSNIHKTLEVLGIDLHTEVLDWEQFRDLQLAFLRSSTPDSEIPTDHAIAAVLTRMAARNGVRHILGGSNFATESIMPGAWSQGIRDWKYIRGIHRRFGTRPLQSFPHLSLSAALFYEYGKRIRFEYPLNDIDYKKSTAIDELASELGWEPYPGKHFESTYTRFFQAYILPRKFGFDKRRGHLSTLICNGEISREEALEELERPAYPDELLEEDRTFVIKKLGITSSEFDEIMAAAPRRFEDYPSYERSPVTGWVIRRRRRRRRPDFDDHG